jgi:hypothetical protein
MADNTSFRQLALSFAGAIEAPHFDKASFRANKKIFATLQEKNSIAMIKLSPADQYVFCSADKAAIYPVPGGWGLKGATYVDLKKVKRALLKEMLTIAYNSVTVKASKK